MKRDCLKHADRKKNDNLNIVLAEEHEEYIGDVLIVSKGIHIFSHDK